MLENTGEKKKFRVKKKTIKIHSKKEIIKKQNMRFQKDLGKLKRLVGGGACGSVWFRSWRLNQRRDLRRWFVWCPRRHWSKRKRVGKEESTQMREKTTQGMGEVEIDIKKRVGEYRSCWETVAAMAARGAEAVEGSNRPMSKGKEELGFVDWKRKKKQGGGGSDWAVDSITRDMWVIVGGGLGRHLDMEVRFLGFWRGEEMRRRVKEHSGSGGGKVEIVVGKFGKVADESESAGGTAGRGSGACKVLMAVAEEVIEWEEEKKRN